MIDLDHVYRSSSLIQFNIQVRLVKRRVTWHGW